MIYPQFSTNIAKLQFTDDFDWVYSDSMTVDMNSSNIPDHTGFIQFNYNGLSFFSTFTSCAYPNNSNVYDLYVSNQFVDVVLNPTQRSNYVVTADSYSQTQLIEIIRFGNSSFANFNTYGQIYNTINDSIEKGRLYIAARYASGLNNFMIAPNTTIYATTTQFPERFQYLSLVNTGTDYFGTPVSNVTLIASADTIPDYTATSNFGIATDNNGGIFFSYQRGDVYSLQPIEIVGNSQLGTDIHYGLKTAYQLFYPTIKIEFTKRANKYNDITKLSNQNYCYNFSIDEDNNNSTNNNINVFNEGPSTEYPLNPY
jgi:hypothetical protein